MSRVKEGVKDVAAVATLFGTLAIVLTYPLILGMGSHIASDPGDPLLVTWILAWDADRMRHGLTGLWNAPNFFPYAHTLLYSEHLLGVAIFTAPLQWLTRNPILVYNVAFLGSFVVSGVGMYVLARSLTGRRDAALVASVIFAFHPFRASHGSHLQLLVSGWLPLSLLALHRYFLTRRLRNLLASVAFYLLQTLTSGYFAYFSLVPLSIVAIYELWRRRPPMRRLASHVAIAAALAAAVMVPIVRGYTDLRRESGLKRSMGEITSQSADVGDYVSSNASLKFWGQMGSGRGEHELFPGLAAVVLALFAMGRRPRSEWLPPYVAILIVAFMLSLGPEPHVFGRSLGNSGPYGWMLHIVPGLDGIRVPARFAIIVQIALGILGALGAAWVIDRMSAKSRSLGVVTTTVLVMLIVAEGWWTIGVPAFDHRGDPRDRAAYAYLQSLPRGAVMELPTRAENIMPEFVYQYMTIVHGHPVVNGHSGYVTPLAAWLRGGHSPLREIGRQRDAVEMLRALGVRYLVIHRAASDPALLDELMRVIDGDPQIIAHRSFEDATVAVLAPFEVPVTPSGLTQVPSSAFTVDASDSRDRVPFLLDGDLDSRWLSARPQSGDEWLTVTFDHARAIRLVRLQLATRSFGDYPRELSIEANDGSARQELFRGSVLPYLARGILSNGDYPAIDIVLPPTQAKTLRLSQRGTAHTFFWSIHELQFLGDDERGAVGTPR